MSTTIKHACRILDYLDHTGDNECIALLVRHSERTTLKGLSEEERRNIGLTPHGEEMAQGLGRALGERFPGLPLSLHHSPIRRCMLTAVHIREGHGQNNPGMVVEPRLGSPVVDVTEYYRLRENTHWMGFNREWVLGKIPSNVITPPGQYARGVLEPIKKFIAGEGLGVFVAHDNTIFPVVSHFLGADRLESVGYLDGLAIYRNGDTVEIIYRGLKKTMDLEEL